MTHRRNPQSAPDRRGRGQRRRSGRLQFAHATLRRRRVGRRLPGSSGPVLFALADIPVGGSVSAEAAGQPLLIAQPSSGTVVAYSAVCTHQGCVVAAQGMRFVCPCHGSQFDAATGAVLAGPASRPLTPVAVTVSGGDVEAGT